MLLSVRNIHGLTLSVGAAALWAYGTDSQGNALGDAVFGAGLNGYTVNGMYWLLAGVVVDKDIPNGSWGVVQAYGAVDSVMVSNWTNWTRHPHMVLRPLANTTVTPGLCSGYSIASTYTVGTATVTGGADEWKPYHACALFAAASVLNTSTAGDATTGTGYIRGFIRGL